MGIRLCVGRKFYSLLTDLCAVTLLAPAIQFVKQNDSALNTIHQCNPILYCMQLFSHGFYWCYTSTEIKVK